MKVKATSVAGRDLHPGDLFSTVGPDYWQRIDANESIGERVYIRTNTPSANANDADACVFKIEIERSGCSKMGKI
ncbi:MAG TPA: hypothetical protein VGH47_04265 [Xanthobacteraceae bacterium]|jgi:hypothetical protein